MGERGNHQCAALLPNGNWESAFWRNFRRRRLAFTSIINGIPLSSHGYRHSDHTATKHYAFAKALAALKEEGQDHGTAVARHQPSRAAIDDWPMVIRGRVDAGETEQPQVMHPVAAVHREQPIQHGT